MNKQELAELERRKLKKAPKPSRHQFIEKFLHKKNLKMDGTPKKRSKRGSVTHIAKNRCAAKLAKGGWTPPLNVNPHGHDRLAKFL